MSDSRFKSLDSLYLDSFSSAGELSRTSFKKSFSFKEGDVS